MLVTVSTTRARPKHPGTRKIGGTAKGTAWMTRAGALLIETAQRPEDVNGEGTLSLTLPTRDYRLLEVLQDDVTAYIEKLVSSHIVGRRKSLEYNAQQKRL